MFVVKQISSKVNTNFISMSVICLMLFITILLLSTGIGSKKDYEVGLEKITPFDASIILYANDEIKNVEDIFDKIDFKISENEKYEIYTEYGADVKLKDLFTSIDEKFTWQAGFVKYLIIIKC